jgi:large subunit ribosomal protein L32
LRIRFTCLLVNNPYVCASQDNFLLKKMAVPKRKTSQSKKNMRRAHDSLKLLNIGVNKTTGEPQLSHQISLDGYYKGRQVIVPKEHEAE